MQIVVHNRNIDSQVNGTQLERECWQGETTTCSTRSQSNASSGHWTAFWITEMHNLEYIFWSYPCFAMNFKIPFHWKRFRRLLRQNNCARNMESGPQVRRGDCVLTLPGIAWVKAAARSGVVATWAQPLHTHTHKGAVDISVCVCAVVGWQGLAYGSKGAFAVWNFKWSTLRSVAKCAAGSFFVAMQPRGCMSLSVSVASRHLQFCFNLVLCVAGILSKKWTSRIKNKNTHITFGAPAVFWATACLVPAPCESANAFGHFVNFRVIIAFGEFR